MEMTLSKLRHHFPHALPQVVEDVDDWLARMDRLLELLKGAIHHQSPLDVETLLAGVPGEARWTQRFRQLHAARAELAPLLSAVAFLESTGRRHRDLTVLEWIDAHTACLSRLGAGGEAVRDLQLAFCTLRDDLDDHLASFLSDTLSDLSFCSTPLGHAYRDYLTHLCAQLKTLIKCASFTLPAKPTSETVGSICAHFLRQLLERKPKSRRLATRLLGVALPGNLAARAEAMTVQARKEERRLLQLLRQLQLDGPASRWPQGRREDIKRRLRFECDDETPALLDRMQFVLNHVPTMAEQEAYVPAWTRFLSCWPSDERGLRLTVLAEWETQRIQYYGQGLETMRHFDQVLTELAALFARRGVHERLLSKDCDWPRHAPTQDLLYDPRTRRREFYRRWAQLLEATLYDRNLPLRNNLLSSLGEFVQGAPDLRRAVELIGALAASPEDASYYERGIRVAFALAGDDGDVAEILKKLMKDWELIEPASTLAQHLADARVRRIAIHWLTSGKERAFLDLASLIQIAVRLGLTLPAVPTAESPTDWPARYPAELTEALAELNRVTPEAPAIAARILRQEFPAVDDLQKEARALRRKLDAPAPEDDRVRDRWQKRWENLRNRLEHPVPTTPQRLENLARKIRARAERETLKRFLEEGRALVLQKAQQRYGVPVSAEQLWEPPKAQVLAGILQLNDAMMELGLRLFCKSFEDPTCDFRTEPRNAAFLESLRGRGINVAPWLDEAPVQTAVTASGEPYRLSFARQIDDVLLMGLRFGTCLSPGRENFFSTIANAVDINKQVLYGKTEAGRVIGRCLFALTDNGALLTYHRYAHDPKDGFEGQVDLFAQRLARAMNTVLASPGPVSTLVAGTWYDDGAVSCESIYGLSNADGPVRTALRTEEAPRLFEQLVAILGSEGTLKSLLEPLLLLEEFTQRREILAPFLHRFAFDPSVPLMVRLRLALRARQAGNDLVARQIVRSLGINSLPRRLKQLACPYCRTLHDVRSYGDVFDLLIDCNPSIALRTLRLTRPPGVKSDAAEEDPDRKEILARCHRALGRNR
ncbi:MAG: hypothetical protein MUC88_16295 [Planctomycetes bacterium]|nr:hypothetical protein [Planctomycetota bacterium]